MRRELEAMVARLIREECEAPRGMCIFLAAQKAAQALDTERRGDLESEAKAVAAILAGLLMADELLAGGTEPLGSEQIALRLAGGRSGHGSDRSPR